MSKDKSIHLVTQKPPQEFIPVCAICNDTGRVYREDELQRGFSADCQCRIEARNKKRILEIPQYYKRFGIPELSKIVPRIKEDPKRPGQGYSQDQVSALRRLKAEPDRSWLLMGRWGTGKSLFGWALWYHAIECQREATALRLQEFVNQYRAWEQTLPWEQASDRPQSRPALLPHDLKSTKKRTIFLDECDKLSNVTQYVSQLLFETFSNIRDYWHQAILCTNLDWDGLQDLWSRQGDVYGNSIMKRLHDIFAGGGIIELR
jgi:DNA replication protein DnaC